MKQRIITTTVKDTIKELEGKITELFQSEKYMEYLTKMSMLHNYSYNNILLILTQYPEASMVASMQTFNKMHRKVIKGSKAIKVLCPCPVKSKKAADKNDSSNGITEEEITGLYFKYGNVFDISQTKATDEKGEIPSFVRELNYNSDFVKQLISILKQSIVIPVNYDTALKAGTANGYYKVDKKEIYLRKDMSDLQTLKTLIHELSHHYQHEHYQELIKSFNRNDLEVSAESSAYVVMQMLKNSYGIPELDSSDYSVGYVASWSKDKSLKELKATLTLITKISNQIFKVFERQPQQQA